MPHREDSTDQAQLDPDLEPSYRTWPTLASDSVAVVRPTDGDTDGVSEGTENVSFVL